MRPAPVASEHVRVFETYLLENRRQEILNIIDAVDVNAHYSVMFDLIFVSGISEYTVHAVLEAPSTNLPLMLNALRNVYKQLAADDDDEDDDTSVKPNLHARVSKVPSTFLRSNISTLRKEDVGTLLSLQGTVTRTGSVMLRECTREMQCHKCKHTFTVVGDISQRGAFDMPAKCPKPGEKECYSTSFAVVEGDQPDCREYQEVKVQEKVKSVNIGSVPRSIIVILTDDIADSAKPGDDVLVIGVLRFRWNKPLVSDVRADIELMLVAESIQNSNDTKSYLHVTDESRKAFEEHWSQRPITEQLLARDVIIKSMCPQIYGLYLVKLIVAMTLAGGVPYTDPSGSRIRGASHLLMVGDPGTAKSQLLRYAAKVSPRSVLTTGIGTTSAGLTVTAVREQGSGEWMLDAGALVLADGGVCCIDEFDGIKKHDRGAIHEAMEQQTLSVAKAGLVCTLDTRATVFAAVNPKGGRLSTKIGTTGGLSSGSGNSPGKNCDGLDEDGDNLPITVGIASPLLSRFDVILTLLDQRNDEWDKQLSSFILNNYSYHAQNDSSEKLWSLERLRQYFYFVRTNLKPRLSPSAMKILTKYYMMERSSAQRNAARTTVRMLQALVRLAQGHARLMYRGTATALDAVFAIAAAEASTTSQDVVGGLGALHAPFPKDPTDDFNRYARLILCKLGMEDSGIDFYDDTPLEDEHKAGEDGRRSE